MWDYYAHTKVAEVVLKSNGVHADENMPLLFGNAITKDKSSQMERRDGGQKPQSRNRHQMLVGDREQTPTRRPHGCLRWQMIWWVKGLMNHPILSDGTNVELLCTHTRVRGSIKAERHSRKQEYAIVIREWNKERQSFRIETLAQGWKTTNTTPTPDVSRRPGANLHQATQWLPPLANG